MTTYTSLSERRGKFEGKRVRASAGDASILADVVRVNPTTLTLRVVDTGRTLRVQDEGRGSLGINIEVLP